MASFLHPTRMMFGGTLALQVYKFFGNRAHRVKSKERVRFELYFVIRSHISATREFCMATTSKTGNDGEALPKEHPSSFLEKCIQFPAQTGWQKCTARQSSTSTAARAIRVYWRYLDIVRLQLPHPASSEVNPEQSEFFLSSGAHAFHRQPVRPSTVCRIRISREWGPLNGKDRHKLRGYNPLGCSQELSRRKWRLSILRPTSGISQYWTNSDRLTALVDFPFLINLRNIWSTSEEQDAFVCVRMIIDCHLQFWQRNLRDAARTISRFPFVFIA